VEAVRTVKGGRGLNATIFLFSVLLGFVTGLILIWLFEEQIFGFMDRVRDWVQERINKDAN